MEPQLYHDSELVSEARARYYRINGFSADGDMSDKWARYKFAGRTFTAFPNFQARVDAIERHDIHHVVNNLPTSNKGEGLIAAWELGSGCAKYWVSWFINLEALWFGIILAPKEAWRQFNEGRRSRNFYHLPLNEDVLYMRLGEVRERFKKSGAAPSALGTAAVFAGYAALGILSAMILIPIVTIFTIVGIVGRQ